MKGQKSEKIKGHGRPSSLPSHRARKSALTKATSRNIKILTRAVFALSLLVVLAILWKLSSRRVGSAGGLQPKETEAEKETEQGSTAKANGAAGLGPGTDTYYKTRDDEILATWHAKFGLVIDAWDPRTHDPQVDSAQYGEKVKLALQAQKYALSAVVVKRVWSGDPSAVTLYECRQWLEYMRFAGVEHVFWYDTAHSMAAESQERGLRAYIQKGFLSYHHFHKLFPGTLNLGPQHEQDRSLLHCLNTYGLRTRWLAAVDVAEYIFVPRDTSPGFLDRYVREYEDEFPDVSQMLLQSITFGGLPAKPPPALLVERYQMRVPGTRGVALGPKCGMKAIFRPKDTERVYRSDPHHFEMHTGKTVAQPAANIRLNHYSGAQRSNASDVPGDLVEDTSMQVIAEELKLLLGVARSSRGASFR